MKVYFISGLAADGRVFRNIQLPEGCEPVYLDWISPLSKESLESYSRRMAAKINATEPFAIIGLSMGGMVASEICKYYQPANTVIISSVPVASQIPPHFKWAGKLKIHKLIPARLVKSAAVLKTLADSKMAEDRLVLKEMISSMDDDFISWAIDAIINWRNEKAPDAYVHIHGTLDRVLPMRYTRPTDLIAKGGHLMVMNRAREINQILGAVLEN